MRLLPLLLVAVTTTLAAGNFIGTVFYGEIPSDYESRFGSGAIGKRSFAGHPAENGVAHIDKVLAYLKQLNDQGVETEDESKHHFSSINDVSDYELAYMDETGEIQNKHEFLAFLNIGKIIRVIKKGIKLIGMLFKHGAKLPKSVMAKANSKMDVKKVPWNGIPKGNHPEVKELIGDAAEVVLREAEDNLRTILQYADTEEGPGFLYKVVDPDSNQIVDSGFRKSETNLMDTVLQVFDYAQLLVVEALTGIDLTPELN